MRLEILLPVLNEERRLEMGVITTVEYLKRINMSDYEITIVDNGSTDRTRELAEGLCKTYSNVKYLRLNERGVGIAFKEGVKATDSELVGYMDIDLSTRISHLSDMLRIFDEDDSVDMVNASKMAKGAKMLGRKWYRNITSYGLTFCMKLFLGMRATDAICGFKFFKRESLLKLMEQTADEKNWFYIIELLIRAERGGYKVVELPVIWEDDPNTKVNVKKLIKSYLTQIMGLRKRLRMERR